MNDPARGQLLATSRLALNQEKSPAQEKKNNQRNKLALMQCLRGRLAPRSVNQCAAPGSAAAAAAIAAMAAAMAAAVDLEELLQ